MGHEFGAFGDVFFLSLKNLRESQAKSMRLKEDGWFQDLIICLLYVYFVQKVVENSQITLEKVTDLKQLQRILKDLF